MVESTQVEEGGAAHGEPEPMRGAAVEYEGVEHSHPGNAEYVRIALILGAITAVEVAIYYLDLNKLTLISALVVLSATKFGLVAAFFMHLKFDSRVFTTFFFGGLVMALTAFISVLFMFRAF
ncbi:MAG: cytochrome C oxidase subunit IV family protein [Dehalococcoidia bacterium]